ncbi:MAG: RNA polymerase factor sigma-54 [Nitrospira sp.]|nr:RNA polymerase factor sigma-54 [Nitrospira sp.]
MTAMDLKLDLQLSQKLVMTPQLQQAIKLLQLSRLELQQVLSQHLLENPLLEELSADADEGDGPPPEEAVAVSKEEAVDGTDAGDGDAGAGEANELSEPLSPDGWEDYYESDWRPGGGKYEAFPEGDFPSYDQTLTKPATLEDHLLWQLRLSSDDEIEKAIGHMIIGNLDEDGYLCISIEEIAEESEVSVKKVDSVLSLIQTFDPIGVAARDLQECLLIQLRHIHKPLGYGSVHGGARQKSLIELMIKSHLHDLQKKRYLTIAKAVGGSVEEIAEAVRIIEGLEPKPGRPYGSDSNQMIVPDVFVFKDEGVWQVYLNDDGMPRVRINSYYTQMLGTNRRDGDTTRAYLEDKLRGAQWIIRSLEQRNKTILKVVGSLIKFQEAFLDKGIQYLKPLVLKQVAEDVGMHESTISRVTTNKYMYCPQGMLELKFFFNAGIHRAEPGAEDLSSVTVRELIREMVGQENPGKPLKDQEVVTRLRARGIVIARRTVAKYRTELNIAPASQRKRI